MIRRTFINKFSFALSIGALFPFNVLSKNNFKLNYAPHLGMFKNSVGDDPIDQINYMADLGFRAFEDNGMRSRSVALQNKISKTLENRGMKMGVFVAHKIYWDKPNLSSGDYDYRNEFLNFIKKSIVFCSLGFHLML